MIYNDVNIDEVLNYLNEWHSSLEIKDKFNLSKTEIYHLLRWLVKAKLIIMLRGGENKDSRKFFYHKNN